MCLSSSSPSGKQDSLTTHTPILRSILRETPFFSRRRLVTEMERRIAPAFDKDHRQQHQTEQGIRSRQEKGTRRGPTTSYSLPQQQLQQQQERQRQRQQHKQQHQQHQQQPSALTQVQPPTLTQSIAPSHTPPTPLPLPQHALDTQQSPELTPPTILTDQRQIASMDRQGVGPTVSKSMEHLPTTITTTSSSSETSVDMLNMSHTRTKATSTTDRTRPGGTIRLHTLTPSAVDEKNKKRGGRWTPAFQQLEKKRWTLTSPCFSLSFSVHLFT